MNENGYRELVESLVSKTIKSNMEESAYKIRSLYNDIIDLCDTQQLEKLNKNINKRIQKWIDRLQYSIYAADNVIDGYYAKMSIAYRMYTFDKERAFAISDEITRWKDVWYNDTDTKGWEEFFKNTVPSPSDLDHINTFMTHIKTEYTELAKVSPTSWFHDSYKRKCALISRALHLYSIIDDASLKEELVNIAKETSALLEKISKNEINDYLQNDKIVGEALYFASKADKLVSNRIVASIDQIDRLRSLLEKTGKHVQTKDEWMALQPYAYADNKGDALIYWIQKLIEFDVNDSEKIAIEKNIENMNESSMYKCWLYDALFEALVMVDEDRAFVWLCKNDWEDRQIGLIGKYITVLKSCKTQAKEIAEAKFKQDIKIKASTVYSILATLSETEIEQILETFQAIIDSKDGLLLKLLLDKDFSSFETIDRYLSEKGIIARKTITAFKNAQIDDGKRMIETIGSLDSSIIAVLTCAYFDSDKKGGFDYFLENWDHRSYDMADILLKIAKEDKSLAIEALIAFKKGTGTQIRRLMREGLLDFSDVQKIVESVRLRGEERYWLLSDICKEMASTGYHLHA